MEKEIIATVPPHLTGIPRVDFMELDYNALVYNKGYDVTVEPAFPCPCKCRTNDYQSSCMNCQGTGWIFGTPEQVKAVITSINSPTKYKEWTAENIGTINVTIESRFKLAFMDKITITDSVTLDAENLLIKAHEGQLYANTHYAINNVKFAFKFVSTLEPLQRIAIANTEGNKIYFEEGAVEEGDSVTVKYEHAVAYVVLDVNHDIRNQYFLDYESKPVQNRLPVSAVARKLHYVIDAQNFAGNNIFYNPTG